METSRKRKINEVLPSIVELDFQLKARKVKHSFCFI